MEYNQKEIDFLKKAVLSSNLADRILTLIIHGSSLYFPLIERPYSDIDLEMILESSKDGDAEIIQAIVKCCPFKVELQYRYYSELSNENSVIHTTQYKTFMFFAYSNGILLYGKNIYAELAKDLSISQLRKSTRITMQISFKDIRKSYLITSNGYDVNKNVMRFFRELGLLYDKLNYNQIGTKEILTLEADGYVNIIKEIFIYGLTKSSLEHLDRFAIAYKKIELYPPIIEVTAEILKLHELQTNV